MYLRSRAGAIRVLAAVGAAAAFGFAAPIAAASPASPELQPTLTMPVLHEINVFRADHGLPALRASKPLARAAFAHVQSMATGGFFTHESADGTAFWKRIQRYYGFGKSTRWSVGENLLWQSQSLTPAEVVEMWAASAGHRKVMLTAAYREVGISAVRMDAATGVFAGNDVFVVAADFGVR